MAEQLAPARPGPGFLSVRWFGPLYSFTPSQAAVVKQLWEAWERGTPDCKQELLLDAAGSESARLSNLFTDNPAWGTMIVPGHVKGSYRLSAPAAAGSTS